MPRLFVAPEKLVGERLVLDADARKYLTKVLRLAAGDEVVIFDGRGTEIEARLVNGGELSLGRRRAVALPAVAITLLQAVAKGDRMDLVVQKTTELGVTRIVPVLAARSVARPERAARWQTIAREAARQSGRADVPEVAVPVPLETALATSAEVRFVLFEGERARSLRRELPGTAHSVALLVGPEGGFTPAEVESAEKHGFRPVGLGPRILRTETAAIVAVALVQAGLGGLD